MASKKKINKKINLDNEEKIINKFNLNLESDDSSDSDDEKLKKQSNRFKFMDSDSDEDDKPIIKIQNDKNKIDLSTELIGKNKPKEKINKKKREEIKKDKNKVDSINNKNLSNILPSEYLEPCTRGNCNITDNTIAIHKHELTWMPDILKNFIDFYLQNKIIVFTLILLFIIMIFKNKLTVTRFNVI